MLKPSKKVSRLVSDLGRSIKECEKLHDHYGVMLDRTEDPEERADLNSKRRALMVKVRSYTDRINRANGNVTTPAAETISIPKQ